MRGVDRLIELRRSGTRPAWVSLDAPGRAYSCGQAAEGQILIEEADRPASADLRVLVGLMVFVHGDNLEGAMPWLKAVLRAGANTVLLCVPRDLQRPTEEDFLLIRHNGEDVIAEAEL
jgi:hypothetical protein